MATEEQPSKITDSIDKDTQEQATEDTQSKRKRSFDPQLSRTIVRGSKAPEIPLFERQNWLIHLLYIRKDFETCKVLIKEVLMETDGLCEYAVYIQGLILRQEGNIQGSLEHFQQAVKLNPNNPSNVKQVARSLFLLGKYKPALDTYKELESLTKEHDWEVLHNIGVCYMHLKDYNKALEMLTQSLDLTPQIVTYTELGRLYLMRGDIAKATEIYRRATKHNPEDPELLSTLGLLYLQTGASQKAFECLGGALTFDPSNYKAILAAGSIIQSHNDYDVALSKYRTAAHTSPESPHLWNNIGMCFYGKKKYVAAISCLKRANYLAPFEWKILHNLGLVHLAMQQYASSFHFLKAGQSLQPKNPDLLMLLGIALPHLDDVENSFRAYEQALISDDVDPLVHLNYAIVLYNNDKRKSATKQLSLFDSKWRKAKQHSTDQEIQDTFMKLGAILQVGKEQETQRQRRLGHDNTLNNEEMKNIESKEKKDNNN